jgi:hypothetical protein
MAWTDALQELLQRYAGAGGGTAAAPADPHGDFQQVAKAAPPGVVAGGLSQAFRSDQTPPFPQMLATLFGQSDPNQRAGLLNRLRAALEPGAAPSGSVTPQQASQVSPEDVQQMAAQAERRNPSVVDEVSGFYAQHPQVVKAVGGLALTIALQHILGRRS